MPEPSPPLPPLVHWRSAGFRGLVRADWAADLEGINPLEWIDHASLQTMRDRASSRVDRCQTPHGVVLVKIISATSDRAAERPSIKDHLKWAGRWSRGIASMRTTHKMLRLNVPCAPIVLAARRRQSIRALDVIVSPEIEGPQLREALLATDDAPARRQMMVDAARAVHRLHARGFMHGDLHERNILLTGPDRAPCFIDNDRTRHWPMALPWVFRRRNLAQMCFRLLRVYPDCHEPFLRTYLDATSLAPARAQREFERVTTEAQRRIDVLRASRARRGKLRAQESASRLIR